MVRKKLLMAIVSAFAFSGAVSAETEECLLKFGVFGDVHINELKFSEPGGKAIESVPAEYWSKGALYPF